MTSTSWKGGSGGWGTASDWTAGIPNSTTADATIAAAGTYLVTIGATSHFTADSVTLDDSTATLDVLGSLTLGGSLAALTVDAGVFELGGTLVNGTVAIENGGSFVDQGGKISSATAFSLAGDGSLDLNGHNLTIAGPARILGYVVGPGDLILSKADLNTAVFASGATLVDAGTIEQSANVGFGGSGSDITALTINSGATYDIVSDTNIDASGTAAIVNNGLFEKIATTGSSTIDPSFTNSATGTIDAAAGTLALNGGGSLAGTLQGPGAIDLDTGTYTLAGAAVVKVAALDFSGSTVALGGSRNYASGFTLQDATVDLNGNNLTLSGVSDYATSAFSAINDINGAGTLVVSGTGDAFNALYLTSGAVLDVTGKFVDYGQLYLGNSSADTATLTVASGATYDILNDSGIGADGTVSALNAGLFEKTADNGVGDINASFANTGTIDVLAGTLQFNGGGSLAGTLAGHEIDLDSSTYTLASAALKVGSLGVSSSDIVLSTGQSAAGGVSLYDSTVNLNGHNLTLSGHSYFSEYFGNDSIEGAGTLVISGTADAQPQFESQGLFFTGSAVLDVTGMILAEGQVLLGDTSSDSAAIRIAKGGVYDLQNGNGISADGTVSIANAGLFEKTGLDGVSRVAASFTNTGTINAAAGTLQFDGGGSLAGTLTGHEIDLDNTTYTLAAAAVLSVAALTVVNGDVVLGGSRNYAENFTLSDSFGTATVNLNGNNLTLSGNSSFSEYFGMSTISGAGTLLVSGTAEAHAGFESQGLFLTGGAVLDVTGTLIQEGQLDLGSSSSDTATLTIASGATYDILSNGGINLDGTASVINAGLFERTGDTGASDISASFTNTGTILVTAGTIDVASLTNGAVVSVANAGFIASTVAAGSGTFDIGASGLLDFTGNVGAGQMIDFSSATGLLQLAQPLGFAGTVNGFGVGDTVDLTGMTANGFSYAGDVLTLTESRNNSTTTVGHLTITGIANPGSLSLLVDGNGGTEIELLNPGGTLVPVGTIAEDDWTVSSGLWSTGSNWNEGVPGLNSEASFSSGLGTLTVTYQSSGTINSIVQSDTSASFDATGGTFAVLTGGVFDGAVTQAAAAVFDAIGGALQFDDGGTLAGTLAGTGTIDLNYGTFTLAAGAALSVGTLELGEPENAFADIVLKGNEAYAGSLVTGEDYNGAELSLNGFNFTLTDQAFLGGFEASGPGSLDVTGAADLSGFSLTGGAVLADAATITQFGSVFLGLSGTDSSAVSIAAHAVYDIVGNAGIYASGTTSIVNAGLFEKTAGDGGAAIGAVFTNTSTGSIDAANGELALDNGGTLAGTLTGAGEIDLNYGTFTLAAGVALQVGTLGLAQPESAFTDVVLKSGESYAGSFLAGGDYNGAEVSLNGYNLTLSGHAQLIGLEAAGHGTLDVTGTGDVNGLTLTNGAVLLDAGTLTQDGNVTLGLSGTDSSALSIAAHGVYDMLTNNTLYAAGTSSIGNAGLFEKTGGDGISVVETVFIGTSASTIDAAMGELQFDGGGSLAGALIGAGEVDANGGSFDLGAAVVLSVATLALSGGDLVLHGSRSFAGIFSKTGNSSLGLNGFNLTLSGSSGLGGIIAGHGTVDITGTADVDNLTVAGGAVLEDSKTLTQDGALQLGTSGTDVVSLSIVSASVYNLLNDTGISAAGTAALTDAGLFEKTADDGTSNISVAFTSTSSGTIEAVHGELRFNDGGSLGGMLSGGGEIGLNGGTFNLGPAPALNVATLALSGGDLILNGSEHYAGSFSETGGSTLGLNGYNLTLSGRSDLDGATISGPGTLDLTGAATLGSVVLTGGAALQVAGSLVQTGNLQLGVGGTDTAMLSIAAGSSYDLLDDSGLSYNGVAAITNAGLFEKTASTGTSYVVAGFSNTGTVIADLGTLFLENVSNVSAGTLSGGTWEAHATLETGAVLALVTTSAISTDAADIILSGGGSEIYSDASAGTAIESGLTSIAATGMLQVLGGKNYFTTGHVTDSGELIVGAGTFKAATLVISSGGSETLLSGGVTSGATIDSGGYLTVSSGGTSSNTHINGGTLEVKSGGASPPSVTFTGSGGEFIVDSNVMPSAVVSGFVAGDAIKLAAVSYATSDTVSVKKTGVVTVSTGGSSYNLNIAGATVGETDFSFGSGSLLTKTTSAQMKFIPPQVIETNVLGGMSLPPLAAVTAANPALNIISAAGQPPAASTASAYQPAAAYDLLTIHRGGIQTFVAPHTETSRLF